MSAANLPLDRFAPMHRIDSAEFDLGFDAAEQARREGPDLEGLLRAAWLPALDAVMDRISPGRRIRRLEKVELDLGRIPATHWRDHFLERLVDAFERELRIRIGTQGEDSGETGTRLARALEHYLSEGIWTLEGEDGSASPEAVLERLLEEGPAELARLFGNQRASATAMRRLVREFSHGTLSRLVGLRGSEAEDVSDILDLLQVTLQMGIGALPSDVMERFWEILLQAPAPSGGASREWVSRILEALAASLEIDMLRLVNLLSGTLRSNPIALKRMPRLERLLSDLSRRSERSLNRRSSGAAATAPLESALEHLEVARIPELLETLQHQDARMARALVQRFSLRKDWVSRAARGLPVRILEDLLMAISSQAADWFDRIRRNISQSVDRDDPIARGKIDSPVWSGLFELAGSGQSDRGRVSEHLSASLSQDSARRKVMHRIVSIAIGSAPVGTGGAASPFEEAKTLLRWGEERFVDIPLSGEEWRALTRWLVFEAGKISVGQQETLWNSIESVSRGKEAPFVLREVLAALNRDEILDLEAIAARVRSEGGNESPSELLDASEPAASPAEATFGLLSLEPRELARVVPRLVRRHPAWLRAHVEKDYRSRERKEMLSASLPGAAGKELHLLMDASLPDPVAITGSIASSSILDGLLRKAWSEGDAESLESLWERALLQARSLREIVGEIGDRDLRRLHGRTLSTCMLADLLSLFSTLACDIFLQLEGAALEPLDASGDATETILPRDSIFEALLSLVVHLPAASHEELLDAVATTLAEEGLHATPMRLEALVSGGIRDLDDLRSAVATGSVKPLRPDELIEVLGRAAVPGIVERLRAVTTLEACESAQELAALRDHLRSCARATERLVGWAPAACLERIAMLAGERAAEAIEASHHIVQALSLFAPPDANDFRRDLSLRRWSYLLRTDIPDTPSLVDLPGRLVSWLGRSCGIEDARGARRAAQRRLASRMPELPVPKAPRSLVATDPAVEGLRIGDAGIVLLSPYLPRLLDMLGLLQDGQFRAGCQGRAIVLLEHLAGGEEEAPDHLLLMHKLLCGMPIKETVDRNLTLTALETDTCRQMLEAVISHWAVLGSTSPEGLQQTFLRRAGTLVRGETDWHLKVDGSAFDVLLDRIPWSFSMVKYAWMDKPLHVEWR